MKDAVIQQVKANGTLGRPMTWNRARQLGALTNPAGFRPLPGVFINLAEQATRRVITRAAAQRLLQTTPGAAVMMPSVSAWVPSRNRIINRMDRITLQVPQGISAQEAAQLKALKKQMTKARLPAYERALQFDAQVGAIVAQHAKPYKAGRTYIVSANTHLVWNNTSATGAVFKIEKDETIIQPFTPSVNMDKDDIVKAAVEAYIPARYGNYDPPEHTIHSAAVSEHNLALAQVPMGLLTSIYPHLPNALPESTHENQCVIDYLLWESRKADSRVTWTRPYLISRLGEQPTTDDIVNFAVQEGGISVYALSPSLHVFEKYLAEGARRICLFFIVNNGHCYPVTDPVQREKVTRSDCLELVELHKLCDAEPVYFEEKEAKPLAIAEWLETCKSPIAIINSENVSTLMSHLMRSTDRMCEAMRSRNGILAEFRHPTRDITVIAGPDYHARRALMQSYLITHKIKDFMFTNQSWGVIAALIFKSFHHRMPESTYGPDYVRILDDHSIGPYRSAEADEESTGKKTSIDQRGCYPSILMNNDGFVWNVFMGFESAQPYTGGDIVPGEYYISEPFLMAGGTIKVARKFYPHSAVQYFLAQGYITKSIITRYMPASRFLPADIFRGFAEKMRDEHPDHVKQLLVSFIGCLGVGHSKTVHSAATRDETTAFSMVMDITDRGNIPEVSMHDGVYLVNETVQVRRSSGFMPIYRQIIAQSYVQLDRMYRALYKPGMKVIGYNTDAIKIMGPFNKAAVKPKSECVWGEYHVEKTGDDVIVNGFSAEMHEDGEEWDDEMGAVGYVVESDAPEVLIREGGLIVGGGGVGKTHLMGLIYERLKSEEVLTDDDQGDRIAATAYSHKACCNLRDKGMPVKVLASLLWDAKKQRNSTAKLAGVKYLFMDEVLMVPSEEMAVIMRAQEMYGFKIIAAGDFNQSAAISKFRVRYDRNPAFLAACGNNVVQCEYKAHAARYDAPLYQALTEFLDTGRIPRTVKSEPYFGLRNLCATNKTRCMVNKTVRDGLGVPLTRITEQFQVCVGMPVMCYHDTDFTNEVFKTEEAIVTAIDSEARTVTLQLESGRTIEHSFHDFGELYDHTYCTTVHKYQGGRINGPFTIWEADHPLMSKNLLYTAMSRGTSLANVNITNADYSKTYQPDKYDDEICTQAETKVTIKHGIIYRITCDSRVEDGYFYIGKTEQTLEVRHAQHIASPVNKAMHEHLTEYSVIEAIEEFDFTDACVLDEAETAHIAINTSDLMLNAYKRAKPVKAKAAKAAEPKLKAAKTIAPVYDASKKRWRVKFARAKADGEDATIFSDSKYGGKDGSHAEALKWCDYLSKKYL